MGATRGPLLVVTEIESVNSSFPNLENYYSPLYKWRIEGELEVGWSANSLFYSPNIEDEE